MKNDLKLSKEKRAAFAMPLGQLISGKRSETIPKVIEYVKGYSSQEMNFFIVGDIVAQDFLANDYLRTHVSTCIIDEMTQRNKIGLNFEQFFEKVVEFENPAGTIHKKAWDIIKSVVESDKRTLIKITRGEEDLLVLPLIIEIPLKENTINFVFYGQPPITDSDNPIPEGIVIVKVDQKIKKTINKFIKLMDKS